MARMRTLKPDAFRSLTLAQVPRGVRWTFAGLWTECDDAGRMIWDARLVKAALYPLDDSITPSVVVDDVTQLAGVGAVHLYEVAGKKYLHIPSWTDHSRPNRSFPSKLPECPSTDHTHAEQNPSSAHAVLTHESNGAHAVTEQCARIAVVEGSSSGVGEGEVVLPAPHATPPKTPSKKRTAAPDELELTMSMRSWARTAGFTGNLTTETEQFLDHHRGKGTLNLDWNASWRTWIRNTIKWGATAPTKTLPTSGGDW